MKTDRIIKLITPDMIRAAKTVFFAMACAETIRPIVEEYKARIIRENKWKISDEWASRGVIVPFDIVTDPNDIYLLNNADAQEYYKLLDIEKEKAGFKSLETGYCPLLIADHAVTQAEHILIETMKPITKLDPDQLLGRADGIETYEKYIDLTLRLLAPFVKTEEVTP